MSWSASSPPKRPGHYLNFKSKIAPVAVASAQGVVCIPFTSDWGPFKTLVTLDSPGEYAQLYGSTWSPGRIAVEQAFKGENLPGFPGAGKVIAYRFGGSTAAKASVSLAGTGGTALTLTARYEGSRANGFAITVQTNASDGTKKDLLIYEGTTLLEQYIQVDMSTNAALVALALRITQTSGWVTAVAGVATGITNVVSSLLTTGNDGSTLAAGDWTSVLDGVTPSDFSVFVPFDLTDPTVQASVKAWVQDQNNNKGKRFTAVLGGLANELITAAITRQQALADENIQTLGVGQYFDPDLGTAGLSLSTSQLAPRYAGALAARGILKDTTYTRFAGLRFDATANSTPTDSDINKALDNGILVISADGYPGAALRIEHGETTYISTSDPNKDPNVFGVPKFMMTMQEFERSIKLWAIINVITPQLAITKDTREFVVGHAQNLLDQYVAAGVLQPGAVAMISQNPPPAPTDDFINIDYQWTFARSVQQVRGTAYVI